MSLTEPLLILEGSHFRGELTDLAVELAARSAGFRSSLPAGMVAPKRFLAIRFIPRA